MVKVSNPDKTFTTYNIGKIKDDLSIDDLKINLTKNNKTITLSFIENSIVFWSYIFLNINNNLSNDVEIYNTESNKNFIEVSFGEIIDKYSILELKNK